MYSKQRPDRGTKRAPKPIDAARLNDLALSYVARFATSGAKLDTYLRRKLRERGWDGEGNPPVSDVVERYVELGYIDDEAYARSKAGGLLRRGYGARRINQALGADGIDPDIRENVQASEGAARAAALAMVRKRRFGPFGLERPDRAKQEKQIAAMLRAGHPFDSARILLAAESIEAAEEWAAEAMEDGEE